MQYHTKLTLGDRDLEIQSNREFVGRSVSGFSLGLLEWFKWVIHGQKDQEGLVQSFVGLEKAKSLHVYPPGLSRGDITLAGPCYPDATFLRSYPALVLYKGPGLKLTSVSQRSAPPRVNKALQGSLSQQLSKLFCFFFNSGTVLLNKQ